MLMLLTVLAKLVPLAQKQALLMWLVRMEIQYNN